MTAMRWELAWRFGIVLTFLLVRHTTALSVSTEEPSSSYKSSDDKYEFVDVAQQQGTTFQSDTGHTSRFFTLGEVDENFWLEHLGDDFKNAIHLQVGGEEQCNGVFNMSENGSAYKVQKEPINNPVLENEVNLSATKDRKIEDKRKSRTKGESKEARKTRRKPRPESKTDIQKEVVEESKNTTQIGEMHGQLEFTTEVYTVSKDQTGTEASKKIQHEEELNEYTKFQHINLKYEPKTDEADNKNNTLVEKTLATDAPVEQTPVVINLPESKKVIELETSDTPVVVKMPPVIYHSEPASVADQDSYTDYTQTNTHSHSQTQTNTHSQTYTKTHPQTQTTLTDNEEVPTHTDDERLNNIQYSQYTYPQLAYEQQQHYIEEHSQHAPNQHQSQHLQQTNFYQHQQTQYPVQMENTQYQDTSLYNQPQQHEYHQQYSKPYISSNYYNGVSSSYPNHGAYPPKPTTVAIHKPNSLESNGIGKYYYAISKRSTGSKDLSNTPPKAASSENSRVTRATQDLYQEGL